MTGYVYFIQGQESHRIKIGYSRNPLKRLPVLQVASPEPLELLGFTPGTERDEIRMHAKHDQYRLHGEWFRPGIGLMADIAKLLAPPPTPQQKESAAKAEALSAAPMRSMSARAAVHQSWANTVDRSARTAPARAAHEKKFLDAADGDPIRAEHLKKAHYQRLALKSAQARRRKKAL